MILCVGDSLTYGNIGYSYIPFLDKRIQAINKGLNGDTTRCAYQRLEKCLNNPKYDAAQTFVVGIGTNDILLPYLTTVSETWEMVMRKRCEVKKCITDDAVFETEYQKYLALLAAHNKKAVLIGIPFIQLDQFPHDITQRRNAVIAALADRYQCQFVNMYDLQIRSLTSAPAFYSWEHRQLARIWDGTVMSLLPATKERFSKKRGLELTVDGVHFNMSSARMLAKAISDIV